MDITLLVFYSVLALGISFICSILEAVVLSVPHTHIAVLQKEGKKSGALWARLKDDDAVKPLTAILTLNTIAHTMGAAGVGSQVQTIWGEEYLTGASIILTIAVLFFSEIVPKTLGTAYWKKLVPVTGFILRYMIKSLAFIIIPIQILKSILPEGGSKLVTRDDVAAIVDLGEDINVSEIMTPRVVMTAFMSTSTVEDILQEHKIIRFSRIPIYEDSIDEITGFIIRSEILMAASRDESDKSIGEFKKPAISILTTDSVDHALEVFLEQRQQVAIVKDEFGGTAGLVTLEDVLETLLGEEIVDELDEVDDMRELAKVYAESSDESQ
jgi:CBS domain containing-hemolysin-like protein